MESNEKLFKGLLSLLIKKRKKGITEITRKEILALNKSPLPCAHLERYRLLFASADFLSCKSRGKYYIKSTILNKSKLTLDGLNILINSNHRAFMKNVK